MNGAAAISATHDSTEPVYLYKTTIKNCSSNNKIIRIFSAVYFNKLETRECTFEQNQDTVIFIEHGDY